MNLIVLEIDPDARYQIMTLNITVGTVSRRIRLELRYLNQAQRWYISISDAATGEYFCRYVPVTASYAVINDLLLPYQCKGIGGLICYPVVDDPSTVDPRFENISEFHIAWRESFDDIE